MSAASAFDGVRTARHEAFVAAFSHIAASINEIYQVRTRVRGACMPVRERAP